MRGEFEKDGFLIANFGLPYARDVSPFGLKDLE
jgi:hypothetical protein